MRYNGKTVCVDAHSSSLEHPRQQSLRDLLTC